MDAFGGFPVAFVVQLAGIRGLGFQDGQLPTAPRKNGPDGDGTFESEAKPADAWIFRDPEVDPGMPRARLLRPDDPVRVIVSGVELDIRAGFAVDPFGGRFRIEVLALEGRLESLSVRDGSQEDEEEDSLHWVFLSGTLVLIVPSPGAGPGEGDVCGVFA